MREEHLDILLELHGDVVLFGLGDVAGNLAGILVLLAVDGPEVHQPKLLFVDIGKFFGL